jgi:hypothetical protein
MIPLRSVVRRIPVLCALLMLWAAAGAEAATVTVTIKKVLPHYLDKQGRHTLSPSLLERDAYQAVLRKDASKRGGLRFDILCGTLPPKTDLVLRVEVRGNKDRNSVILQREKPVTSKDRFHRWQEIVLDEASCKELGDLVAWRATLWQGSEQVAEQRSFLW